MYISYVNIIYGSCRLSFLKERNIFNRYDWNLKFLVLWKFISWEWIFSAKNSSNLMHDTCNDWLFSPDSTRQVLKMKRRLIRVSWMYVSMSRPKNWHNMVTTQLVSSLNRAALTGNDGLDDSSSRLKHLLKISFFLSTVESLKYWSIDSSL